MSEQCLWLHEQLELVPILKYGHFKLEDLPLNGIYFFYEDGEYWGHGGEKQRIVRIGTHKNGNFRNRINEHFLITNENEKMNFNETKPSPRERSIFRKNIGRSILHRNRDEYLKIWEIDYTYKENIKKYSHLRDISKEKEIEKEITSVLRNNFSFRCIEIENENQRMGSNGLESSLIGTIANCDKCHPSSNWLGTYSPKKQIYCSGLWLVQHLKSRPVNEEDKRVILEAIKKQNEDYNRRCPYF